MKKWLEFEKDIYDNIVLKKIKHGLIIILLVHLFFYMIKII